MRYKIHNQYAVLDAEHRYDYSLWSVLETKGFQSFYKTLHFIGGGRQPGFEGYCANALSLYMDVHITYLTKKQRDNTSGA